MCGIVDKTTDIRLTLQITVGKLLKLITRMDQTRKYGKSCQTSSYVWVGRKPTDKPETPAFFLFLPCFASSYLSFLMNKAQFTLRRKYSDSSKELLHFETMGKWNITVEGSELDGGHSCRTLTHVHATLKKDWCIQAPKFFPPTAGCMSVNGEKWKVMVLNCVLGSLSNLSLEHNNIRIQSCIRWLNPIIV